MDPETIVLPLHHSPVQVNYDTQYHGICQGDPQNNSANVAVFLVIQCGRSLANSTQFELTVIHHET